MIELAVLVGQKIVWMGWDKWPREHCLEVEGSHVLEIAPWWDSRNESACLLVSVSDEALR